MTSEMHATPDWVTATLSDPIESIAGKGVVITGGTTGIGRATALVLAAHGAHVLIFGRNEQPLAETLEAIRSIGGVAHGLTADQTRPEDIARVFRAADEQLERLDILVNNASLPARSVLVDTDYAEWDYVIRANVIGYIACTREAADRMKRNGGGHIVNIGSLSAKVREKGASLYVATKSAVEGLSESLRKELGDYDIKVSLIEPGSVGSGMVTETPTEQAERQAQGKMLKAEDIAWCVYYCLTQPKRCDILQVQICPNKQFFC